MDLMVMTTCFLIFHFSCRETIDDGGVEDEDGDKNCIFGVFFAFFC